MKEKFRPEALNAQRNLVPHQLLEWEGKLTASKGLLLHLLKTVLHLGVKNRVFIRPNNAVVRASHEAHSIQRIIND